MGFTKHKGDMSPLWLLDIPTIESVPKLWMAGLQSAVPVLKKEDEETTESVVPIAERVRGLRWHIESQARYLNSIIDWLEL